MTWYGQEADGTTFVRWADGTPHNFRTRRFASRSLRDVWVADATPYRYRRAVAARVGRSDFDTTERDREGYILVEED